VLYRFICHTNSTTKNSPCTRVHEITRFSLKLGSDYDVIKYRLTGLWKRFTRLTEVYKNSCATGCRSSVKNPVCKIFIGHSKITV